MNSQPKKIRSINKFNPSLNLKGHNRNQSINLPLGTPTQSNRPLNKELLNEKSHSPVNISCLSARGSNLLNLKGSNNTMYKNEEHKGGLILDGNNSFRYNSGMKKIENSTNQLDKNLGKNKSNTNLNLLGTVKSKFIKIFINI